MRKYIVFSICAWFLSYQIKGQLITVNAGTDTTICSYSSIHYGVQLGGDPSASGLYPPFTCIWYPPTGLSSDTDFNPVANPGTTIEYYLKVIDSRGDTAVDSVLVTILPTPEPVLTDNLTSDTICSGTLVTFTITPDSFSTISFFDGGSLQQFSDTGNTWSTYALSNESLIYAIVTLNDCPIDRFNSRNFYSNIDSMHVLPEPLITVEPDTAICSGQPVTITATASQAPADSFSFWINSVLVHTGIADTFTYSFYQSNDTVTVAGELNGCTSRFSQPVIITVDTVSIFITGDAESCSGTESFFSANANLPGTSPVYQWLVNGLPAGGNSSTFSTDSLQNGDAVSCKLIAGVPCAPPDGIISAPIVVKVAPSPGIPGISQLGDTLVSSPALSYQWYMDGSPIQNANSQDYIISTYGSYYVAVFDSNGCYSFSESYTYTNVTNLTDECTVNIFPNPSTGNLFISATNFTPSTISIFDIAGRKLSEQEFTRQIDISSLPPGVYFIEVTSENELLIKKVVKMQ